MNDLITINTNDNGVETVNARDLHAFLGSKQNFADWIKARIRDFGFAEGQDFTNHKIMIGKATQIDYHLTLDMAKELSMVERNDKGKQARLYFIECERRAKNKVHMPKELSRMELIQIAMASEQERIEMAQKLDVANEALAIAKPKVDALDRIASTEGSFSLTEAAKNLQLQPKQFMAWLYQNGYTYRRTGGNYLAYESKTKQGLFEHKTTTITRSDGTEKSVTQVRVTAKGITYFSQKYHYTLRSIAA